MVQFEELMLTLQALKPDIDDLSDALGMKSMKSEIEQLELKATEPGFWDNVEKSQQVLQKTGALKGKVEAYEALVSKYEDTAALIELANEEEDLSLLEEAQAEVDEVRGTLEKQRLQTLLTGEYDKNNAILTFHAGSGGTEAQDWAEMLYRMYTRWARLPRRRRSGTQERCTSYRGRERLRLPQERGGSSQTCARISVRFGGQTSHELFRARSNARDGRQRRDQHRARGHQDGRIPRERRRRSEG